MSELSVNHLLGIKHLNKEDIQLILDTAAQFKEVINRPIKKVPTLRDITIANLFFENSTRTRLSFELAEKRLTADVVNFSASSSSVKKGETLVDTVNNILAMKVDMVVMPWIWEEKLEVIAMTTIQIHILVLLNWILCWNVCRMMTTMAGEQ